MKLVIERAALLKALAPAVRIIERTNTIPILANVRLDAEGVRLRVTATDLDIEIRGEAEAEVETAGGITVPGARLNDIVRKLPDNSRVTIEASKESVTVRSGRSRFQMPGLPISDFPQITPGTFTHEFELPAETVAAMLAATQFAICTDATRYYLNGIFLHALEQDGKTVMAAVATDSHRLARFLVTLPQGAVGMPNSILPRKTVAEIARLVDKAKEPLSISLGGEKIRVTLGAFTLSSKLIDGVYPDYQRVIPCANDKLVTVEAPNLAGAADRVATISGERGRCVKLALADGRMELTVTNPDSGSAREELDCEYESAPIEIGFNARYLSEILGILGGDTIQIRLSEPGAPAILQTREDSPLLTVLMPMRV
ncbi:MULTISPECIES: DNA polymerase III subunit beta [unclassified Bosea (in: a-proteobacteria)]|uniref:DNA polymerase III subunit beta n=1 Tax=unclassified Bosea (in: a-proteobacteria) TaxID=2653178 RepID=UPI000F759D29|nr:MULTISPECIES: DNA polymerase III subunit beta [unclassified Bosea (in: a-proteobacteria)]AZO77749.1 DNA polymerase III subunit beta [Bosea sp. Tri-49]RXT18363.1 DNA polymerase III subunit beta [Bosea sp. Tri-39]RXT32959.1 DNA polymerase III subunit beta [Bosea sp. Tri-54]